jgi:micrococcal nuclease
MKKLLLILMFVPLVSFGQDFKVVRVIDGDTFIIEGGERVRMIGIDAPELKDLYGVESKNQLKALIQNKHVKLIKGVVTANKDYFKRLLRYVYIDSTDINLKMIEHGFASVYLKYPFSKSSEYKTIFDYIKTNKLR